MFKEPRARRAWNLYFLKAEAVLSPLKAAVRKELLDDLKTHVADILTNERIEGDELARLNTALERVGDPKEFLAPLLASAVFRAPPQYGSIGMAWQTVSLYAARGGTYFGRAVGLVLSGAAGLGVAVAAFNSLLRPDSAGVFRLAEDEYQMRILGLDAASGEQLLAPWMAIALIAAGGLVIWWAMRKARHLLIELITSAA